MSESAIISTNNANLLCHEKHALQCVSIRVPRNRVTELIGPSGCGKSTLPRCFNRLNDSALGLSGGQQQRLCIARTLAVEPDVIPMDEPCSALDPIATAKIENLIERLKEDYTAIIVTHNMQRAEQVSDYTGFMYLGIANLMSIPPMADIVIDMVDDAVAAYESDNIRNIDEFSSRDDDGCAPALDLPRRDHLHDGRSKEHPALHTLHHRGPVPRAVR